MHFTLHPCVVVEHILDNTYICTLFICCIRPFRGLRPIQLNLSINLTSAVDPCTAMLLESFLDFFFLCVENNY